MRPVLTSVAMLCAVASCSSGSEASTAPPTSIAVTTSSAELTTTIESAPSTTIAPTTVAPTTTMAPTGSAQSCEVLRTLDDPDADGWGECIVSMQNAREQYLFISGTYNVMLDSLGNTWTARECTTYLAGAQTFNDELNAATWPAEVIPQLNELLSADQYQIFSMDAKCRYATKALGDAADLRLRDAVFAWRQAIGAPTDI